MILLIMLIGIGLFGIYWIRANTMEQQFEILEARTFLLADSYSKAAQVVPMAKLNATMGTTPVMATTIATIATSAVNAAKPSIAGPTKESMSDFTPDAPYVGNVSPATLTMKVMPSVPLDHVVQIYDESNKQVLSPTLNSVTSVTVDTLPNPTPPANDQKESREVIDTKDGTWLRVGVPYYQQQSVGGVYYVSTRLNTDQVQTYIMIMVSIGVITLCGWAIVYVLSRSLTHPLRQLALAAQQVSDGNYRPELPDASRIKESEISQLVHSFDDMTNRLGQLERMRTDLLAGVSHELRTPVTSIRGMIQAVKDGVVTGKEADEFMQISMDEAKRLQTMVNDLLDFTSMEAGALHSESSTVQLTQAIQQMIAQLQTVPAFASITTTVKGPTEHDEWKGDPAHLKQILLNLLNNSASAGATSIAIHVEQLDERLRITVTDNGGGIPLEEVPFIFERYYRGDSKRKKKHGLGLGLTICRMLAQANGGNVELLNTSTQGSTFCLTLANRAK